MRCQNCKTKYRGSCCPTCGEISEASNKTKCIKRTCQITATIIFLAVFSFVIVYNSGAESKQPPEPVNPSTTNKNTAAATTVLKPTFGLGDTIALDSINVTAVEIKKVDSELCFIPEDGNEFIGIKLVVENVSKEEKFVGSFILFDAFADNKECEYSINANGVLSDKILSGSIKPGEKIEGYYALEVPKDFKKIELKVNASVTSDKNSTFTFYNDL